MVDLYLDSQNIGRRLHALGATEGFDPDTPHLRFDFTITVVPHAATWTITQTLGAIHWARHTGGRQHTLTTHFAIE
jgi:hypothetical protein